MNETQTKRRLTEIASFSTRSEALVFLTDRVEKGYCVAIDIVPDLAAECRYKVTWYLDGKPVPVETVPKFTPAQESAISSIRVEDDKLRGLKKTTITFADGRTYTHITDTFSLDEAILRASSALEGVFRSKRFDSLSVAPLTTKINI